MIELVIGLVIIFGLGVVLNRVRTNIVNRSSSKY